MITDILPTGTGFSSKVYNFLKWFALIFLPAFATLYFALSGSFVLPNAEGVLAACAALATFLGALLGISNRNYKASDAEYDGDVIVQHDPGGKTVLGLELNRNPDDFPGRDKLVFKVVNKDDEFWEGQQV